jgi:hypothetical protein
VGVPEESAIQLLQDPEAIEQELSKLEAHWLVAIRAMKYDLRNRMVKCNRRAFKWLNWVA